MLIGDHARAPVKPPDGTGAGEREPARLVAVLSVTALGSVSGGVFASGLYFLTREHYRFSPPENLALALCVGAVYTAMAWFSGGISRRLAGLGARRLLTLCFVLWAASAALPVLVDGRLALWVGGLSGTAVSGLVWPIVESYLGGGRHGGELRRALGRFNLTWTLATALPMLVFGALARIHPLGPLALSAVTNVLTAFALLSLPREPQRSLPEHALGAVGPEYPALLAASRWLLPVSYLLSSTMSPVLPHRLAELGTPVSSALVASTWMVARFATLGVMTIAPFWHGRWGALVAGGSTLVLGVALTLLGDSLGTVVLGLALFGVGMGLTYFCAIYYTLAVGHGAVDAGGGFEALIGVGYVLGPVIGLTGRSLPLGAAEGTSTVALAWLIALGAGGLALRPYLEALRVRRAARAPVSFPER
jgi:hypothetical protein